MLQVLEGESTPKLLKATLQVAVTNTRHKNINLHYAWEKASKLCPETLQPPLKVSQEVIRGQWTTHTNIKHWLVENHGLLLEHEMAIDKPSIVDGHHCNITVPDDILPYVVNFDETQHNFSNITDSGGTGATTYTNTELPWYGSAATQRSQHTTGVYGVAAHGDMLPPLYISDLSAKNEENYQVRADWVRELPRVKVKFGCPTYQEVSSFVAVSQKGSMTEKYFYKYLDQVVLPLFPKAKEGKWLEAKTAT